MGERAALNGDGPAGREKSYNRIKIRLSVAGIVLNVAAAAIWAFSGVSSLAAGAIARIVPNDYPAFFLFMIAAGIAWSIIDFPMDFYGGYLLEHRFGLSNQTLAAWAWEKAKGAAIGAALGLPVVMAFYFFLRQTGWFWWIYFGGFMFFLSVLLARVAPVVIFPLFYKFRELESDEVRRKIEAILESQGIAFRGIYSFNLSKDTNKANAGFAGIGRSRRIILSDTLIEKFTPDEIAVVFAHEVGHYRERHIAKGIVLGTFIIFASLFVCGELYRATILRMGFERAYDIAAVPVLFFYLALTGLVTMPITNWVSRRHERAADRHALETTGDPGAFISAMEKLAELNLADRDPNPAAEFLFYGHPSINKRISFARGWEG